MTRRRAALVLLVASCGCRQADAPGMPHDAYVWQHRWTPAVARAVVEQRDAVRAWRILGAEVTGDRVVETRIDVAAVRASALPVVLVVRINGRRIPSNAAALVDRVAALARAWGAAGIPPAGLEVDHDSATRELPAFAAFMRRLRPAIVPSVPLSITALPTWLRSASLRDLLASVDEVVLQVHSVSDPRRGLLVPERARRWVVTLARISPVPFRVALPTYGSRVESDEDGRITGIASEVATGVSGHDAIEVEADPRQIAGLLRAWRRDRPPGFAGVAWFRLPTGADRRAWTPSTWRAVLDDRVVETPLRADAIRRTSPGLYDVFVANPGPVDAPLPRELLVADAAGCAVADGLAHYDVDARRTGLRFVLAEPGIVRARRRRMIGWMRCADTEVDVVACP